MLEQTLLTKIYLASRQSISRVVSRIVPPNEIEDIVQETYVRICQVQHKENISSPKSFMFKTAKNLALDYIKQAHVKRVDCIEHEHELERLIAGDEQDEMFNNTVTNDEFGRFCQAVRQLPLQCRKVFVLKKVYGYSQQEIATKLMISESTVEKHIALGIKRCTLLMNSHLSEPKLHHSTTLTQSGERYE